LGHKVSSKGLEVEKAKINMIAKLPPPTKVKSVRSFLGHAGFYRRFIKDFSKISSPMTKLLKKDSVFNFDEECNKAFETLKEKLTNAPIMVSLNWSLPFELMCDARNFAIGAVLGQRDKKQFRPIHFASKTLNSTQQNLDHLSQLEKPNLKGHREEEINDEFPNEFLKSISTNKKESLWFAEFANYLVGGILRKGLAYAQRSYKTPIGTTAYQLLGSFIVNGHHVKLYHDEEQLDELTTEEIYLIVVENTCNEAKLYDLDETRKGIVIENIPYVPSEGISLGKK
nr:reverse transcriptase domain-containing protein [Tanacetum cinerariifolium]